jgi:hypothetical protein
MRAVLAWSVKHTDLLMYSDSCMWCNGAVSIIAPNGWCVRCVKVQDVLKYKLCVKVQDVLKYKLNVSKLQLQQKSRRHRAELKSEPLTCGDLDG